MINGSNAWEYGTTPYLLTSGELDLLRKRVWRVLLMNKSILKAIEYSLTAAGLLIGILFIVLIIRGG